MVVLLLHSLWVSEHLGFLLDCSFVKIVQSVNEQLSQSAWGDETFTRGAGTGCSLFSSYIVQCQSMAAVFQLYLIYRQMVDRRKKERGCIIEQGWE